MSVRPYSPLHNQPSNHLGVVLFNHLGSTVNSDSGDDAAYIAEKLAMHVIAVDRPGSGWELPVRGHRLAADYVGAMSRLLSKHVLPEVDKLGLEGVVVFGRSAGGHGALAAGRAEQLPVVSVHTQDPIGWQKATMSEAKTIFGDYMIHQRERQQSDDPDLIRPEPTGLTGLAKFLRDRANNVRGALDVANHQRVWREPSSHENALVIARTLPGVRMDLVFAEDTYVLGDSDPHGLHQELIAARIANGSLSTKPVVVDVVPNTTHASFDLRSLSASLLANTVEQLWAN
jgi:pimeloyl-ACP methyl ester carboxylesterase